MLGKLYATHKAQQTDTNEHKESCKVGTLEQMSGVTSVFAEFLTKDITDVYVSQKELDKESRLLLTEGRRLTENTLKWIDTVERLNKSLNEIGDIENWASVMEKDLFVVSRTLEKVCSLPPSSATTDAHSSLSSGPVASVDSLV